MSPDGAAIAQWLAGRRPAVPPALAARLDAVARTWHSSAPDAGAEGMSGALAALGVAMLRDVTRRPPQESGVALDLLAADAFVTYAVEAAAEEGRGAGPFARTIIHQVVSE